MGISKFNLASKSKLGIDTGLMQAGQVLTKLKQARPILDVEEARSPSPDETHFQFQLQLSFEVMGRQGKKSKVL